MIIGIVFISEFIFSQNNVSYGLQGIKLYLFKMSLQKNDYISSMSHLNSAVTYEVQSTLKEHPDSIPPQRTYATIANSNLKLKSEFMNYLKQNVQLLTTGKPESLSKAYFNLALIAYNNSEQEFALELLETAVLISPEWSYFPIELANIFLITGNNSKAVEWINYCKKFTNPRNHCVSYEKEYLSKLITFSPGKFQKEVENILN